MNSNSTSAVLETHAWFIKFYTAMAARQPFFVQNSRHHKMMLSRDFRMIRHEIISHDTITSGFETF